MMVLAFVAVFFGPSPLAWLGPSTSAELSFANGTYRHPCCEPIVLVDGVLKSGDVEVSYVIDKAPAKQGGAVFLRPEQKVFVSKGAKVALGDEPYPSSLLLDKAATPPRTILLGGEGMKDYSFVRAD